MTLGRMDDIVFPLLSCMNDMDDRKSQLPCRELGGGWIRLSPLALFRGLQGLSQWATRGEGTGGVLSFAGADLVPDL